MSPLILFALLSAVVAGTRSPVVLELKPFAGGDGQLLPRHPYGYLSLVANIGTPARSFSLALNTASVKSFVPKAGFPKGNPNTTYYDPARSSTAKSLDKPFDYSDEKLNATGQLYEDQLTVSVNGTQFGGRVPLGVISQLVGVETLLTDGELGLGWTPYYRDDQTEPPVPIIHTLLFDQYRKIYQLYSKPFEVGHYLYGVTHNAVFDSSIGSVSLPSGPFRSLLNIYNAKFDFQRGVYLADCSKNDHEWKITIDRQELKITDKYALVDIHLGDGRCALMIEESRGDAKTQIYRFGMPLFHQYCVTFDVQRSKFAFTESTEL